MGQGAAMREYEMEVLEKYELEVNIYFIIITKI